MCQHFNQHLEWCMLTGMTHMTAPEYFARMSSSLGDKSEIVQYLSPGRVLDVGAGGGDLSALMSSAGFRVTALDGSLDAVNRIKAKAPEVEVVYSSTTNMREVLAGRIFENIVCSSVLHEVFSYASGNVAEKMSILEDALVSFYELLEPGGRLVIRDGVAPQGSNGLTLMHLSSEAVDFLLNHYVRLCPFVDFLGDFQYNGDNTVLCTYRAAMEFAYTFTWGVKSAQRECKELYGVTTRDKYISLLESHGFRVVNHYEYLQVGYYENLRDHVNFMRPDTGDSLGFPSSNMVIVAEKPEHTIYL